MLSNEQLAASVELGVETRAVEFKGAGSTGSKEFVATVARACIALANQREGGHVVIGVVDSDPGGASGGLDADQLAEWLNADNVLSKINTYADPPLVLRIEKRELPSGAAVVVIEVAEFDQVPVLAARDFGGKITKGQLYTRSMAKPESTPFHSQNELREVLQLATEKQLQSFLRTARQAGLRVEPEADDEVLYQGELRAFLEDPITSGIPDVPHLQFSIRPRRYDGDRVPYESLGALVRDNVVRKRGWPFPWYQSPQSGAEWIAETQVEAYPETWSLHRSGQFVDLHALPTGFEADRDGFNGDGPYLPIWAPVLTIAEAAIFASRLQTSIERGEEFEFTISLQGARGWELVAADPSRSGFHRRYAFTSESWSRTVTFPGGTGEEEAKEIAAGLSRELLLRFGWSGVTLDIVRGIYRQGSL
ncbi:helix-turn-helix domain-containing protein [Microbacterium sp. NPDC090225]|uniref:AlbA family DNA-binding domain-containing protein n=1 Tax=Microbacterium sp. NPDC090225 TaxID=3364207 RepID=UPI003821639B